jgi:hypothetical protein
MNIQENISPLHSDLQSVFDLTPIRFSDQNLDIGQFTLNSISNIPTSRNKKDTGCGHWKSRAQEDRG